ncbi:hypothetical protein Droror1_Dr00007334 [Drosera rotundifolia]
MLFTIVRSISFSSVASTVAVIPFPFLSPHTQPDLTNLVLIIQASRRTTITAATRCHGGDEDKEIEAVDETEVVEVEKLGAVEGGGGFGGDAGARNGAEVVVAFEEKIVLEGRVAMEHKTGEGIVLTSETKYKSKKRGLSLEEKREKMLQIFYDSQDFFLLKELEKLGPKKGVISQSVKDVIQSLVDDDLVLKDKIGSSIYFWSLPSTAGNQLRNVRSKLESELKSIKKRFAEFSEKCNALKKGREESDEREEALNELKSVESKYKQLKDEMAQYADNDPAAIEEMRKAVEVACSAANRWTDNIFTLRQWCSNNFPQAKEQLENMYREAGVTDDFDYLELPALSSVCITEGQK